MKIMKFPARVFMRQLSLSALLMLTITGCDTDIDPHPTNPVPLEENWRMFINHVHTVYSEDNPDLEAIKSTVGGVIAKASDIATASNTDAIIAITDHRTVDAIFDPEFVPVGNAIPIIGEEWGREGHAGVIGFSGDTPITAGDGVDDYEAMITETHERGGLVIVNHPIEWKSDRALDADAVEILNGPQWDDRAILALAWWQRLLIAGEQITAIGGTDSHFFVHPIQLPMNLVYAPSNSPDDMLTAIESGRVMLLQAPTSARALLEADLDNDGVYDDTMMGDKFAVAASKTVSFQVRTQGANPKNTLRLIDRNGVFYEGLIGAGPDWDGSTYRFTRRFSPLEKNFVRAEIDTNVSAVGVTCITNPIYAVGTETPTNTEASLQGVVRVAGVAIEGASIEAKPGENSVVTSSADGSYALILPLGAYTVTVTLPDSSTQVIENVVLRDEDVVLDMAL